MTTHHDLMRLLRSELDGGERDDVLEALAKVYVILYDDEVHEVEHEHDHDVLDDTEAHHYYRDQYDRGGDGSTTYQEQEVSKAREISVPTWAPHHRRLLRALARDERMRDNAALRYYQAHHARLARVAKGEP